MPHSANGVTCLKTTSDMPDKIQLENAIYYMAACEQITLCTHRGLLQARGAGSLLQDFVAAYNHYFYSQNKKIWEEENRQSDCLVQEFYANYLAQQRRLPLKDSFHLVAQKNAPALQGR